MHHYTDRRGYRGISSQPMWLFEAHQPPGDHPRGAYFTTLPPTTPNLAVRLRIPREKLTYGFDFTDVGDLVPLRGGRGDYVLYSPEDYAVAPERQNASGETGL
jgi:hypothetical protein